MKALLRSIAREVAPPFVVKAARRLRARGGAVRPEWEILPGGWGQARRDAKIKGWNEESVMRVYAESTQTLRFQLKAGVPFGLSDALASPEAGAVINHNVAMAWGWVLGRTAGQNAALSVLDWGGAFGNYYLWARALRPDLKLDYTVKEMPLLAKRGAELVPQIRFVSDESVFERRYDLVVASTALHYEEDWRVLLQKLLGAATHRVFINRLPLALHGPAYVFVQRPYAYGYQTEYQSWCLNRAEFIDAIEASGWRVEREIFSGERVPIVGAPELAEFRGFLLCPATEGENTNL